MRGNSNGNGNDVECTECDPPRRFKSKSGLNGHTQFKHGHLPDNRAVMPNGKQSQMFQQILDGQDEILDALRNGNGQGNGNGYSREPIGVTSPPRGEPKEDLGDGPKYRCDGCNGNGLIPGQRECPHCGQSLDWNGAHDIGEPSALELPVQMPRL